MVRSNHIPMYRLTLAFAKELEWATLPNIMQSNFCKSIYSSEYFLFWPGHRCTFKAILTPTETGALLAIECLRDNHAVNREVAVIPQALLNVRGFKIKKCSTK